ncbi:hypothetical protein ACLOJK_010046 [Asimina triloba]
MEAPPLTPITPPLAEVAPRLNIQPTNINTQPLKVIYTIHGDARLVTRSYANKRTYTREVLHPDARDIKVNPKRIKSHIRYSPIT